MPSFSKANPRIVPLLWGILIILLEQVPNVSSHFHACEKYGDTYGEWRDSAAIQNNTETFSLFEKHFFGGGSGEALQFTQVWVPNNCSYHRFTNATIHKCVDYIMKNKLGSLTEDKVRIIFLGDSAMRGIFCGLGRILSGSEVYGPNINVVCGGGPYGNPVTASRYGQYFDVDYGQLTLTFIYIKNFDTRHLDWTIEYAITVNKPFAVVLNTGKKHKNINISTYCLYMP